jgi:hypothetical protein
MIRVQFPAVAEISLFTITSRLAYLELSSNGPVTFLGGKDAVA